MLTEIAKYHDDWLRFAKLFTSMYAEDMVQEMYIKASAVSPSKYTTKKGINKNFFFTIIKNLCVDYHRAKEKVVKVDFIDVNENDFKEQEYTIEQLKQKHEQHNNILEILRNEDRYLEMYYLVYTDANNPSYRNISEKTNLNLTSIHFDMQKVKKIIRENGESLQ